MSLDCALSTGFDIGNKLMADLDFDLSFKITVQKFYCTSYTDVISGHCAIVSRNDEWKQNFSPCCLGNKKKESFSL